MTMSVNQPLEGANQLPTMTVASPAEKGIETGVRKSYVMGTWLAAESALVGAAGVACAVTAVALPVLTMIYFWKGGCTELSFKGIVGPQEPLCPNVFVNCGKTLLAEVPVVTLLTPAMMGCAAGCLSVSSICAMSSKAYLGLQPKTQTATS